MRIANPLPTQFCVTLTLLQTTLLDTIPSTPQRINTILKISSCFQNGSHCQEKTKPSNTITKEEGNKEGPSDSGYGQYTRCSSSWWCAPNCLSG